MRRSLWSRTVSILSGRLRILSRLGLGRMLAWARLWFGWCRWGCGLSFRGGLRGVGWWGMGFGGRGLLCGLRRCCGWSMAWQATVLCEAANLGWSRLLAG